MAAMVIPLTLVGAVRQFQVKKVLTFRVSKLCHLKLDDLWLEEAMPKVLSTESPSQSLPNLTDETE